MKTHIASNVATARLPGRPIPAAMGTAGWTQAEADRSRIRTVLRAPPDWRVPATTNVPASAISGSPSSAQRLPIRAKLKVGGIDDPLEREADRIAAQVVDMPATELVSTSAPVQISRKCTACEEEEKLQKKSTGTADAGASGALDSVREALRSPGQPLDASSRAYFKSRFGHDFSRVQVHFGAAAEQSAQDIAARAYTVGDNIVFGAGGFAPESTAGRRLLAHELTHVLQNAAANSAEIIRRSPDPPPEPPAKIVSPVWNVQGRAVVVVEFDGRRKAFYQRSAGADRPEGHAGPKVGDWAPFDGWKASRRIEGEGHFVKENYHRDFEPTDELHGFGNPRNKEVSAWLGQQNLQRPAAEQPWEEVQVRLEKLGIRVSQRLPLAPAEPPARTVSGEIGGKRGGGGGGGGGGGAPPPKEAAVTEATGAPLEPVVEATTGFEPAAGAGIGGAVQLLQAMMFGNLQKSEIAKFEDRLAKLQPKIDHFLATGYSVELLLIVEKPNSPDVLCGAGVFCDQGQLIYFHDLYINYVESVKPIMNPSPRDTSRTSMSSPGGRDSFVPYTHQGGSIIDEKEIPHLSTRDPNHHCEYGKLTLYPQGAISPSPITASRPPAQPVKTRPRLDPATKKALALAPSRVYLLSENIQQYKKAYQIEKKLSNNASFVVAKADMGGGVSRSRTLVSYFSNLDQARAEALAAIVRSEGLALTQTELSGDGDDIPGVLQIFFGRDAE